MNQQEKKKKHNKIVLQARSKLNNVEVLISKTLIDSNINPDEFASISNVMKKMYNIKEQTKNSSVR